MSLLLSRTSLISTKRCYRPPVDYFLQKDLLGRAAEIGGQLRETSKGLEALKAEVLALRQSIR